MPAAPTFATAYYAAISTLSPAGKELHHQADHQTHPSPLHPPPHRAEDQGGDGGRGEPQGALPVCRVHRLLLLYEEPGTRQGGGSVPATRGQLRVRHASPVCTEHLGPEIFGQTTFL